jgi:ATP-dependent DNA ligase
MKTLYQLDSNGNTKVWTIDAEDKGSHSTITVRSGRLGGNLVENVAIVSEGKNSGKSNETDHYSQAISEMESKIAKQLKKGYVWDVSNVKSSGVLGSGIQAPMLAQKYHPTGEQKGSKTLSQLNLVGEKIIVQPKLDGNRCMIKIENGKAIMYTRKGDVMPVQLSHITNDLTLTEIYPFETIILDGELFSDQISFNTLNGLIKRVKATPSEIETRKFIKFHLYDIMVGDGYEIRKNMLTPFSSENVIIVPSYTIEATDESIKKYLEVFLAEGHEGLMIRQLGIGYENKRTWQLCKVKLFDDAEFLLVGFEEDKRGGFVGAFVMQDSKGRIFNAGASGQSVDERVEMLNNQSAYLGKMATVCYFGLSEYGIPRFPKFKGVR